MGIEETSLAESKSAEAINATKNAAEAVESARAAQMAASMTVNEERMGKIVRHQVENVLASGSEQDKSIILARVPYICQDIKTINARGQRLEDAMTEQNKQLALLQQSSALTNRIVYGAVGAVLLAFIGGLTSLVYILK